MNVRNKNLLGSISVAIFAVLIIAGVSFATSNTFTPPTGTTANYRTLGDIYAKLTNFALNPSATHSVSTTTNPAGSFFTLGDIYGLLTAENTDLVPDNIRSGVIIFGVTGNYTGTGNVGSSLTLQPPISGTSTYEELCYSAGTYELTPTTRSPYLPACSINDGLTSSGYGAKEYCENLSIAGSFTSGWRLPNDLELVVPMVLSLNTNLRDLGVGPGGFAYLQEGLIHGTYWTNVLMSNTNYAKKMQYNLALDRIETLSSDRHLRQSVRCVHD